MGQPVENVGNVIPPQPGKDVWLSIDSRIQYDAYNNLRKSVVDNKARDGTIVVLDAKTGAILAMASYPSFSPLDRIDLDGSKIKNRAVTDTFEPGSTIKPIMMSLALQKGVVTPDSMIDTNPGYLSIGGYRITDTEKNGLISVEQVIQRSSNIGSAKIALRMTPKDMWEMYRMVGFGQKPNLPLPGVASGLMRPYETWRPVEQATLAYGYGLSMSLMQMAHAYLIFATDGTIIPVSILKQKIPIVGVQVIAPKYINEVRKMLSMVTSVGGTGQRAQAIGYSVGGKTGTARLQEGKGYAKHKYRGLFVGLAPMDNPRIVVAVVIEDSKVPNYYGAAVAAPVFSATVQDALSVLGVKPDILVKPGSIKITEEKKKKEFNQ
jgi:cell division protein FtsI (penicillin-binding protein 3)